MQPHPDLTHASVHPYEAEAQKYGLVTNHWGQRVTSLIPLGDSVFVSTSAKGTYPWDDRYTFLTDGQRREYGAVLRLRMPGNLAAQIEWRERPIQLTFLVSPDRLTMLPAQCDDRASQEWTVVRQPVEAAPPPRSGILPNRTSAAKYPTGDLRDGGALVECLAWSELASGSVSIRPGRFVSLSFGASYSHD